MSETPGSTPSYGGIASASPSAIPAPETSNGVRGIAVELSSSSSQLGEPVIVSVTVPRRLAGKSVVLVTATPDDVLTIVTPPVLVNDDLVAYMTVDMGTTTTFTAIVPADDLSEETVVPTGANILGQSEEFTITVN